METLFTADLVVNGQNKSYDVSFVKDAYVFRSSNGAESFQVTRSEDAWHVAGNLPSISQQQAIHALDQYLLSQH